MQYAVKKGTTPFWACVERRNGLANELSEDYTPFEALNRFDFRRYRNRRCSARLSDII